MPYLDRYPANGIPARTLARMSPAARGLVRSRGWGRPAPRSYVPDLEDDRELEPLTAIDLPPAVRTPCWEGDGGSYPAPLPETDPEEIEAEDFTDEFDDDEEEPCGPIASLLEGRAPAKPDYSGFLAALRAKPRPTPAPAPTARALPEAQSREGCATCGIPGFKGCEHQAPYVAAEPEEFRRAAGRTAYR